MAQLKVSLHIGLDAFFCSSVLVATTSTILNGIPGLSHLHSLTPPAVHMNFKTSNVLVDEDFAPKVADTGIPGMLDRLGVTGLSSRTFNDPFVEPR